MDLEGGALGHVNRVGPDRFIYVAAAYRGKLTVADASAAFDEAIRLSRVGDRLQRPYDDRLVQFGATIGTRTQVPASDELYVFGIYNVSRNWSTWVAVYPGLRDGKGRASQRLLPGGRMVNAAGWTSVDWHLNGLKCTLHYADDDRGGLAFAFSPPTSDRPETK